MGANDPMTEQQANDLKSLAEAALEPEAFRPDLNAAEASVRITALRTKLRLMDGPPHTL